MTAHQIDALERENAYLKLRCAQLQEDVCNLEAQVSRLSQQLDRVMTARAARIAQPNPLSGGQ